MTPWTRAEVLAFVAHWSRLGVPRARPRVMGVYDGVTITLSGGVFVEVNAIDYRAARGSIKARWSRSPAARGR